MTIKKPLRFLNTERLGFSQGQLAIRLQRGWGPGRGRTRARVVNSNACGARQMTKRRAAGLGGDCGKLMKTYPVKAAAVAQPF